MAEEVTGLTTEEQEQLERILGHIPGGELITGGGSSGNSNGQGTTEIIVYQPEVSFRRRDIQPFAPTYVGVNDHLVAEITNTVPNATIIVRIRFQNADGSITPYERTFNPPATGLPSMHVIPLREGWLYGISVTSTGIPIHNAAYVRVGLQYGTEEGRFIYNWWLADIVNDAYTASWPVGRQFSLKELLGITDYDVISITSGDVESPPQVFSARPRRIDIIVRNNPVLFRFYTIDGTPREQFRVEAGTAYSLDGSFPSFSVQSAVAGHPARVQVVGWW